MIRSWIKSRMTESIMFKNYLLILLTVAISVTGQTLLKVGMKNMGRVDSLAIEKIIPLIVSMGTNVFVIAGLSLFVIGTFFWLIVLSRLDLSFVYPFGALQYIFIYAISYFFLGEHISAGRIAGVSVVLCGILIIGKFG
jgi:drug/metabolite transporter (DMT)-like permease